MLRLRTGDELCPARHQALLQALAGPRESMHERNIYMHLHTHTVSLSFAHTHQVLLQAFAAPREHTGKKYFMSLYFFSFYFFLIFF